MLKPLVPSSPDVPGLDDPVLMWSPEISIQELTTARSIHLQETTRGSLSGGTATNFDVTPVEVMHMAGFLSFSLDMLWDDAKCWHAVLIWADYLSPGDKWFRYKQHVPRMAKGWFSEIAGMGLAGIYLRNKKHGRYFCSLAAGNVKDGRYPDCCCHVTCPDGEIQIAFECKGTTYHDQVGTKMKQGLGKLCKTGYTGPMQGNMHGVGYAFCAFIPTLGDKLPEGLLAYEDPPCELPRYSPLQLACMGYATSLAWVGFRNTARELADAVAIYPPGRRRGRRPAPLQPLEDGEIAQRLMSVRHTFARELEALEQRLMIASADFANGEKYYYQRSMQCFQGLRVKAGISDSGLSGLLEGWLDAVEYTEELHAEYPMISGREGVLSFGPSGSLLTYGDLRELAQPGDGAEWA